MKCKKCKHLTRDFYGELWCDSNTMFKDFSCFDEKKPRTRNKKRKLAKSVDAAYEAVAKFHKKINHPNPDALTFFEDLRLDSIAGSLVDCVSVTLKDLAILNPYYRRVLRAAWLLQELGEFLMADTEEAQVDALCDIMFFVLGTFGEMGYKPGRAFQAVLDANMKKNPAVAGEKVTKPDGWIGPEEEIRKDIARQRQKEQVSACAGE